MPVRRQSKCKELSNGLIIRKDMASSGAMMAQTFSFTIPQSPGMDTAHCKRETRSSLKSSRDPRVPRRPMFRNPEVESPGENGRQGAPLCRPFSLEVLEVKPLYFLYFMNLLQPGLIIFFHHGQQTDRTYPPRNGAASGNRWRDHRPLPQLRKDRRTH